MVVTYIHVVFADAVINGLALAVVGLVGYLTVLMFREGRQKRELRKQLERRQRELGF